MKHKHKPAPPSIPEKFSRDVQWLKDMVTVVRSRCHWQPARVAACLDSELPALSSRFHGALAEREANLFLATATNGFVPISHEVNGWSTLKATHRSRGRASRTSTMTSRSSTSNTGCPSSSTTGLVATVLCRVCARARAHGTRGERVRAALCCFLLFVAARHRC